MNCVRVREICGGAGLEGGHLLDVWGTVNRKDGGLGSRFGGKKKHMSLRAVEGV